MSSYSLISNRSSFQEGGRPDGGVSNLTVALRIRPLNQREKKRGSTQVAYKVTEQMVVLMDPQDKLNEFLRANRTREKKYVFDCAFGPESDQQGVYEATAYNLIESVLEGYNVTVFAYGATGAGKTHTMLGSDENPGIMARALNDLFAQVEKREECKYEVNMSYLEIYNESIRDLLKAKSPELDLREDSKGNVQVPGLSNAKATSSKEILKLLLAGNQRRTQEPTDANQTSSRSHAVLQVNIIKKDKSSGVKAKVGSSKLFMIDLAGSERASQTKNRGQRLKEGAHINRSLLALAEKHLKYVNYRDSKLTRLLKDSLGGNSRTVMIAHISPASMHFEESRTTLTYADRAKNITTKLSKNDHDVTQHVTQYQSIIGELRKEIARLKSKIDEQHSSLKIAHKLGRSESATSLVQAGTSRLDSTLSQYDHAQSARREKSDTGGGGSNSKRNAEFETTKNKLKESFQEQMKLRHKLMDLNVTAFDAATALSSKAAVLSAWDEKNNPNYKPGGKPDFVGPSDQPNAIKTLRGDVERLHERVEDTESKRSEVEWDLANTIKKSDRIQENTVAASTPDHRDVISLMTRLHEIEVEKTALQSDAVLLNRRLDRQASSLVKVQKYHEVANKLVNQQQAILSENNVEVPKDSEGLYKEFKTTKGQAHYHLLPLDAKAQEMADKSWNSALLEQQRAKFVQETASELTKQSASGRLTKTMDAKELRNMKQKSSQDLKLPPISGSSNKINSDDEREYSLEGIRKKAKKRQVGPPNSRGGSRKGKGAGNSNSANSSSSGRGSGRSSTSSYGGRQTTKSNLTRSSSNRQQGRERSRSTESKRSPRPSSIRRHSDTPSGKSVSFDDGVRRQPKRERSHIPSIKRNPPNRRIRSPTQPTFPVLISHR